MKQRTLGLQLHISCSSDDSDDSDGALGTGLSLDPSTQHTALTVKSESCEQGEGLAEGKPLNGVLLQGKGKIYPSLFLYFFSDQSAFVTKPVSCSAEILSFLLVT